MTYPTNEAALEAAARVIAEQQACGHCDGTCRACLEDARAVVTAYLTAATQPEVTSVRNVYAYLTPALLARSARELDDLRRRQYPTPHFVVEKPREVFLSWEGMREASDPEGPWSRIRTAFTRAQEVEAAHQRVQQWAGLRLPEDPAHEVAFLVARALGGPLPEEGYNPPRLLAEAVIMSPRGQFTHNLRITNG